MRRTAFRLLVVSSAAILLTAAAFGRTRPRYGDSVRAEVRASVPSYEGAPDLLAGLVFETLVTTDDSGRLAPGLAVTWTSPNGGYTWQFALRNGMHFHDGSPVTPLAAATAISKSPVPGCKLRQGGNLVEFACDSPQPNLPAMLSQPRFLIFSPTAAGDAVGTGPFRIEKRDSDRFSLKADDDYWAGRTYLDAIELVTDRTPRDQITDFTLDRTDIVQLPSDQLRRAQQDHIRTDLSRPAETVYLVVNSAKPELRDIRLRQAISLAIDRGAIHNVIFQRKGEVAGGLLPNWMTGYAFLFPTAQDLAHARQLRSEVGNVPSIAIAYNIADPLERLIAERIALNVGDIGVNMQAVASNAGSDLRLSKVGLPSSDPATALNGLVEQLGIMPPANSSTLESLYTNERAAVQTYSAIPLVHLPKITAMKDRIHNWTTTPTGTWNLDQVWVTSRTPTREGHP
jgi:peptide/nickel transport system substrate-binding protein